MNTSINNLENMQSDAKEFMLVLKEMSEATNNNAIAIGKLEIQTQAIIDRNNMLIDNLIKGDRHE